MSSLSTPSTFLGVLAALLCVAISLAPIASPDLAFGGIGLNKMKLILVEDPLFYQEVCFLRPSEVQQQGPILFSSYKGPLIPVCPEYCYFAF